MTSIAERLGAIRAGIAETARRVGRDPAEVRLIAVSKTITPERVREAVAAGQQNLGENKVQEGLAKAEALADLSIRWSMIGHLQTNKVRDAVRFATEVQSLDRLPLATALEKRLQQLGQGLDVLVQVNTSDEASKYGLHPDAVADFLRALTAFDSLRPKGFMTLARFTPDQDEVRRCFRRLRDIRDRSLQDAPQGAALGALSMGMSGDYLLAIEEGATVVRVGQAIFGARPTPNSLYWPGETTGG